MPCYSPLKGFRNLESGGIVFKRSSIAGEAMEVACGQCLGCRLDRSRMWAIRIVHEASLHDDNCFLTLTYVPVGMGWIRKGFMIPLALVVLSGCSATSLRCGVDGDSSFVELYGAPQHMSQNTRQFGELCGFAYDSDRDWET